MMNKHRISTLYLTSSLFGLLIFSSAQSQEIGINSVILSHGSRDVSASMSNNGGIDQINVMQKQLVNQVLSNMGIDPQALPSSVRESLAQPHTQNFDALMSFSEGIDLLDAGRFTEAKAAFDNAAKADPNFALAANLKEAMPEFDAPPKKEDAPQRGRNQNRGKDNDAKGKEKSKISAIVSEKSGGKAKETAQTVVARAARDETSATVFATPSEPVPAEDMIETAPIVVALASRERSSVEDAALSPSKETVTSQNTIDNYITATEQNLVDDKTFSNNENTYTPPITPSAVPTFATFFLSQYMSMMLVQPNYPYMNITDNPMLKTATGHETVAVKGFSQQWEAGYINYDALGNITSFLDFYGAALSNQNPSVTSGPVFKGNPDTSPDYYELNNADGMQTGEYAFMEFAPMTGSWFADAGSGNDEYKYTAGGVFIAGGSHVQSSNLNDLQIANAVYNYSGETKVSVSGFGPTVGATNGVTEFGVGNFSAQIDFGAMQVTQLQTVANIDTGNYQVGFSAIAPMSIDNSLGTFNSLNDGNFEVTIHDGAFSAIGFATYMTGQVNGSNAKALTGVFSSVTNNASDNYYISGAFLGIR